MIPSIRSQYNSIFTKEKYQRFLQTIDAEAGYHIEFRIAETPVFVAKDFRETLIEACDEILQTVYRNDFKQLTEGAVPKKLFVPNEDEHPGTIAIDFAVCKDENGKLIPQLIEMQGFSSLFGYEHFVAGKYREHFWAPENFSHLFSNLTNESYLSLLREWIVGNHDPESVVLLEIEPEKQKTRVDFELTKKYLGINYCCISKVIREGRKLFYEKDGKKIPIYRIYNRVIFDELMRRKDLQCQFHMTEDVDVEWNCHPNWFFRISKYTMPFLNSRFVPKTTFVNELKEIPGDLENYVLKPLFSFSGAGVIFDVKREDITNLSDPSNYILQRKVQYEPVIASPTGPVKAEIRMLFIWLKEWNKPKLVINLARLSKGKMIGVDFNKNMDWVGGTVGLFEK